MSRIASLALALALGASLGACIPDDNEPDLVWNVDVTASQLVVGQTAEAHSAESLADGTSSMPLAANWNAQPEGLVTLSSDIGADITLTAISPGTVTLFASAGGAQGGVLRQLELVVSAP